MKSQNVVFDFKYFIDFALNDKISWEILEMVLDDHSKTLSKSRELNKILLQQLKAFKESKQNQVETATMDFIEDHGNDVSDLKGLKTSMLPIDFDAFDDTDESNSRHALQNRVDATQECEDETFEVDHDLISESPNSIIESGLKGYEKDSKVQINPKIKCGICGQTFHNPLTFKKHKEKVHENSINSKKMDIQENKSINKPKIKCQICDTLFKTEKGLKNHQIDHADKVYENEVEHDFSTNEPEKTDFDIEMLDTKKYSNDPEMKCDFCDKTFLTSMAYKKHMEKTHGHSNQSRELVIQIDKKLKKLVFECETCDRLFITQAALRDHEVTHTDEKVYSKKVAANSKINEKIASSRPLKKQKQESHNFVEKKNQYQTDERMFQCKMCSKTCEASELRLHGQLYHKHQKLAFECAVCGKSYDEGEGRIRLDKIKVHQSWHMKQILRKGPLLKYKVQKLGSQNLLERMNQYRRNGRLYQCKMCSRKCKVDEVRRHIKLNHKHQKLSFECTLCGKIYQEGEKKIISSSLKIHEARHKNEMQKKGSFKCNECPKTFSDRDCLRKHLLESQKTRLKTNVSQC